MNPNGKSQEGEDSPYKAQVLDRAFGLLDLLSEAEGAMPLASLANAAGLHKSTAHRLLLILERHGYVERSALHGEYRLGSRLLQLGMRFASRLDVRERGTPFLAALVKETGETAHVGVLRQGQAISVAHCEARHNLRIPATVGRAWPAHCAALGKAILAFLPQVEFEEALRSMQFQTFTRNTIRNAKALRTELVKIRRAGYAVDAEEYEIGLTCISAPIFDALGRAIAAVAIEGPVTRLTKKRLPELSSLVRRRALELSEAMGFTGHGEGFQTGGLGEPGERR